MDGNRGGGRGRGRGNWQPRGGGGGQGAGGGQGGYNRGGHGGGGGRGQGSYNRGGQGGGRDYGGHHGGNQGPQRFEGGGPPRGGGGFRGGRQPTPRAFFKSTTESPNPYDRPFNDRKPELKALGWKPFEARSKDEVILQEYQGKPGSWAIDTIDVSVNHFPVESTKGGNVFPFPKVVYHYDISYKMEREGKKKGDEGVQKKEKKGKDTEPGPSAGGGTPPEKKLPKDMTQNILTYLIPKIRRESGHYGLISDLRFNLYSTKRFHGANPEVANIHLQYIVPFKEFIKDESGEGHVIVSFEPSLDKTTRQIKTIRTEDIAKFVRDTGSMKGIKLANDTRQTVEAVFNAFVKSFPNFEFFSVGRATMVPISGKGFSLGGGIAAWNGISAHIVMGWKPYLNVDIANCAFMVNEPVPKVLAEIFGGRAEPNDTSRWGKGENGEFEKARSFLRSCKISYDVDGKRLGGPVTDVLNSNVSNTKFMWEEKNKEVSVFDYYFQRYNLKLKHPNGPVLVIRKKSKIPAELCVIKKGQSYNRKLDGFQTTGMIRFAKKDPAVLEREILDKMKGMNLKENQVLKEVGMQIPDKMLNIKARVLVPPTLRYGEKLGKDANNNQIAYISPTDGTWDCWQEDFAFYRPANVEIWGVLVVGCDRMFNGPQDKSFVDFVNMLMDNGRKKNVAFSSKPIVYFSNECRPIYPPEKNANILGEILKEKFKSKGCKLVVVVFPKKPSQFYAPLKHAAEVDVGILTQCIVADKNIVPACKIQNIQNLLLKINSKLGGANHVVVAPFDKVKADKFCSLLMDCPILIMGADVTHAPPGSKKFVNGQEFIMPSYAAVTGSLDKTCMPFMTEVRAQRKANAGAAEVIQDLETITKNMLISFRRHCKNTPPQKIIYFRDGVGDGQFPEVLHVEMNAMRKACKSLSAKYEPKITFITVQKRHKTRIFHHTSNGTQNAPAGTVIDTEIVHPTENDFYLLSHKGMLERF